jgi:hypothetical protein
MYGAASTPAITGQLEDDMGLTQTRIPPFAVVKAPTSGEPKHLRDQRESNRSVSLACSLSTAPRTNVLLTP